MNKIVSFFKNFISFDFNRVSLIRADQKLINFKAAFAFIFIFLFLAISRPLYLNFISLLTAFEMCFLTASIFSIVGWIYYTLLMKKIVVLKWTFKKDLIHFFNVTIISTCIYLIYSYFGFNFLYKNELEIHGWKTDYKFYVWLFFCVLFCSSLILTLLKFIDYSRFLIYDFPIDNKGDIENEVILVDNNFLSLLGKNKDENIVVDIKDFIYLESFGHYAKAYLKIDESDFKTVIFRNSINKVIQEMDQHNELFQCHRSYIVNINKVISIEGNSKKAFLTVKETNACIPLSRESYTELKKKNLSFEKMN